MSDGLVFVRRIRRTPYSNRVEQAGVRGYSVYNHMILPKSFGMSVEEAYWHLREHVQLWDVSVQRQVEITGPDAGRLVQWMTPRALEMAGRVQGDMERVMSSCDVFMCPTNAIPAVPADFDHSQDELVINGRSVQPMLGWVMTVPFNMASNHPVISLPNGRAENGVPIGAQLVGQPFRDEALLNIAHTLELLMSENA